MKSQNNAWRQSRVYHGKKQGRLLGFPTLNLDPLVLPKDQKEGVYAAIVKLKGKTYKAALFLARGLWLARRIIRWSFMCLIFQMKYTIKK